MFICCIPNLNNKITSTACHQGRQKPVNDPLIKIWCDKAGKHLKYARQRGLRTRAEDIDLRKQHVFTSSTLVILSGRHNKRQDGCDTDDYLNISESWKQVTIKTRCLLVLCCQPIPWRQSTGTNSCTMCCIVISWKIKLEYSLEQ